jgi:phenylpyruvate tautomerase PptA (4-oxalocrotonate tautomerase family)
MPLLKIETNVNIKNRETLLKKLSTLTASLTGKPESWVMVYLHHNPDMLFSGKAEPLIYAELKSVGLPEKKTPEITAKLMDFLKNELNVQPDRMYVEFSNARPDMWGWNMETF